MKCPLSLLVVFAVYISIVFHFLEYFAFPHWSILVFQFLYLDRNPLLLWVGQNSMDWALEHSICHYLPSLIRCGLVLFLPGYTLYNWNCLLVSELLWYYYCTIHFFFNIYLAKWIMPLFFIIIKKVS
jgi:hypothetical protein